MTSKAREPQGEDLRLAPPRAPQRVMQIIAELASAADGLSLTQLSESLELPKTSLFSLLRSLEAGGYIISENGHHRLGPETYKLAVVIQKTDRFPGNVRALLMQLHEVCGETVVIGVPSEDWTYFEYVDVIEASSWLRFSVNVGAHRPLYSTSLGLILLSYASPAHLRDYLEKTRLEPVTSETVTTKKALLALTRQVREAGYVASSGSVEGVTGVAAPVFSASGDIMAAVGITSPTIRCQRNHEHFQSLIVQTGQRMSQILGYAGPYPKPAPAEARL